MSEKLQILNMLKEGTITAEEGVELLEALDVEKTNILNKSNSVSFLKIKAFDPEDETKLNISIPTSLFSLGLKLGKKFSPEMDNIEFSDDELEEIITAIKDGQKGQILNIDSGDGEKIEIFIE